MLSFLKPTKKFKEEKVILQPFVSFKVSCEQNKAVGYAGFNLKNPEGSNRDIVVCPSCNRPYTLRIKSTHGIGHHSRIGSKHVFEITNITKTETERVF